MTEQSKNNNDEFGDDDAEWDEYDLAAIDLSVAMAETPDLLQKKSQPQFHSSPVQHVPLPPAAATSHQHSATTPLQPSSSALVLAAVMPTLPVTDVSRLDRNNSRNNDNEFDNDDDQWDEEDLAMIDLRVASVTKNSHHNLKSTSTFSAASGVVNINSSNAGHQNNDVGHVFNGISNANTTSNLHDHSEFSDDDDDVLAHVDFSAWDKIITTKKGTSKLSSMEKGAEWGEKVNNVKDEEIEENAEYGNAKVAAETSASTMEDDLEETDDKVVIKELTVKSNTNKGHRKRIAINDKEEEPEGLAQYLEEDYDEAEDPIHLVGYCKKKQRRAAARAEMGTNNKKSTSQEEDLPSRMITYDAASSVRVFVRKTMVSNPYSKNPVPIKERAASQEADLLTYATASSAGASAVPVNPYTKKAIVSNPYA